MAGYSEGDTLALELDLNHGTLTALKKTGELGDWELLGKPVRSGLSGAYCWCVELFRPEDSVTIKWGAPAAWTAQERALEQAQTQEFDAEEARKRRERGGGMSLYRRWHPPMCGK